MTTLVSLSVTGASQKNVIDQNVWAVVRKKAGVVLIDVQTGPKGTPDEWKTIKWTGAVPDKTRANRGVVPLDVAGKVTVKVECGLTSRSIDLWIVSADVEILTKGLRPKGAAPRDLATRDGSENLGAVTYPSMSQNAINDNIADDDPDPKHFVFSTSASGKIVAVGTLLPNGVSKVLKAGWTLRREVFCHTWLDGVQQDGKSWTIAWTDDTSGPRYLRLVPGDEGKIYDLDEPDMRWGKYNTEMFENFRQWVEWNGERCSEYALWHFNVRWQAKADPRTQIELIDCGTGNPALPDKPHYARRNAR